MKLYYSPAYVGSAYAFETTRKAKWVADSLMTSPLAGIELAEPRPLTWEQVAQVHDAGYVEAARTGLPRYLAQSQGFAWDPGLWPMVLSSNGGVVAACLDALENRTSGSLSSGLHHARAGSGAGFCTFNGLVIAAREALAAGARSVLILDLDAHCGGGTASLIAGEPRIHQVDVAVNSFDYYRPQPPATNMSADQVTAGRVSLTLVSNSGRYLPAVEQSLSEAAGWGDGFDLCLYNAGMDPFEGCDTGGLMGITGEILAERERMVFSWCGKHCGSVAFVLAGGYVGWSLDGQGLVDLHRLTLSAAAQL